jgi:hypothetical protein
MSATMKRVFDHGMRFSPSFLPANSEWRSTISRAARASVGSTGRAAVRKTREARPPHSLADFTEQRQNRLSVPGTDTFLYFIVMPQDMIIV